MDWIDETLAPWMEEAREFRRLLAGHMAADLLECLADAALTQDPDLGILAANAAQFVRRYRANEDRLK